MPHYNPADFICKNALINLLCSSLSYIFAVEQVKGLPELRQKIISAAKEARKSKDYPVELQHHDCLYISDKYAEHTNRVLPQPHGPYPNLDRKFYKFLYTCV